MFSETGKPAMMRSAAWRISLWATLAFAFGTMVIFVFLHRFVSSDIQQRSDAWLSGEVQVLGDVAGRTPKDRLYGRVVGEVAELASRELPNKPPNMQENESVFFLQTAPDGSMALWVGKGDGLTFLDAIRRRVKVTDGPSDLYVQKVAIPFRLATASLESGSHIYLGLSEKDELRLLRNLRLRFFLLWLSIVLIGFAIVFYTTRRMLAHVRKITEAASRIGESDLGSRVPMTNRNDEVSQLALTLNTMLDRIENSVHQLHTITNSLAHDLRSPLTAVRAKLEIALTDETKNGESEGIVSAIEELDRVTEFLNKSLDVAEAKADALRIDRVAINIDDLLRVMIDLYEPSMSERGLIIRLRSTGAVEISADAALLHRMIANLFDNEMKHLPPSCTVDVFLYVVDDMACLALEDDGPGFAEEISAHLFESRVKGPKSNGRGLGLAFVEAVVRTHGGSIEASNRVQGGARLVIKMPLAAGAPAMVSDQPMAFASH